MGYFVQDELCRNLVHDVIYDVDDIQQAASLGLSAALKQHPDITDEILQQLIEVYKAKLKVTCFGNPTDDQEMIHEMMFQSF